MAFIKLDSLSFVCTLLPKAILDIELFNIMSKSIYLVSQLMKEEDRGQWIILKDMI